MTILTTPRLRLEPFSNAHFEELYYLNKDITVMQYITGRAVTLDETIEHMELVKRNWIDLGFSSWSLIDRETGEYIGSGGIQHIEFNPANPLEMGWRLKPGKWKQGYATEAAQAMMQFIFQTTDIDTLYALCHQENVASERVMHRLNMQPDGIAHWYGLDVKVYKLLRQDFEERQRSSQTILPQSDLMEVAA